MHVPLSLKMSATWENEKLSSSIVPRICNLSITQVIFNHPLEDMTDGSHYSFFVSVRMRDNTRRVLRSPELNYPSTATDVVYLDFSCAIQYSHALKRDSCNYLQLLIQRRKKYKKKTVNLGYKTIAYCTIDLAQVLQRKIENKFLDLYDNAKSMVNVIGRVEVKTLNTMPLGNDLVLERRKDVFEEEDEGMHDQFSEPDDSDRAEDSDYDPNCGDFGEPSSRQKKIMKAMSIGANEHHERRRSSSPQTALPEWQKQIKQKIMGLLKKVKLMEHSEELDPRDTRQLWDEIEQLDNVSEDSDIGDIDTTSIQSTPRPTLRPFFGHSGLPDHPGTCNSEDSNQADSGAKLLKKLHLETSGISSYTFCNSNFTDVMTSTGEKVRTNDGSETTEDEIKTVSTTKKDSGSQDKDSTIQRSSKTKSKSSKPSLSNISNNPNKKEVQKPKKQISGIMKTFSFTTSPSTALTPVITTANSHKFVSVDSYSPSFANENLNSDIFSTTIGSPFITSNTVMTPLFFESTKENINCERKAPTDINLLNVDQTIRQRSSSTPHNLIKNRSRKNYDSDTKCSSMKVIKFRGDVNLKREPRLELVEQVNQYLHNEDDSLDIIYIINLSDYGGKYVSEMFNKEQVNHIAVISFAETKFSMIQILNRLRKKSDNNCKICLLGSDCHLNNILRVFVDQINLNYSKEIVNYFRFFLIPITGFSLSGTVNCCNQFVTSGNTVFNNMARRLCIMDSKYASLFSEFIQFENITSSDSLIERDNKFLFGVHDYLQADCTLQCPIGDCLVACSVKPQNNTQDSETSAESFIPFLCEVRLGEVSDIFVNKADGSIDDQLQSTTNISPPRSPIIDYSAKIYQTTSSSAATNMFNIVPVSNSQTITVSSVPNNSSSFNVSPPPDVTSLDLQLEYWTDHSNKKVTLKSAFRQVLVNPTIITTSTYNTQHSLSLTIISKEKKQKIIRIAKKAKNESGDSKKETFDEIIRILCTSKSQNALMKVTIDGVMWTGVKFFQLNPYWRTQIKTFPIATFFDN